MQAMKKGTFTWFGIPVRDMTKSKAFYTELLGWEFERFDESEENEYWMIKGENGPVGGMFEVPELPESPQICAVMYFVVDSVDSALEKAKALGGKVALEKTVVAGDGGVYAHIKDLSGNLIGMWEDFSS